MGVKMSSEQKEQKKPDDQEQKKQEEPEQEPEEDEAHSTPTKSLWRHSTIYIWAVFDRHDYPCSAKTTIGELKTWMEQYYRGNFDLLTESGQVTDLERRVDDYPELVNFPRLNLRFSLTE